MLPENLSSLTFLYPTDTTFGLGCNSFNEELVQKIHILKNRPSNKSFVLLVDSQKRLMDCVSVPDMAWELMEVSDKPLTLVYDQPTSLIPDFLKNEDETVAIRLTKDSLCKKIIQKINAPILSTSANISGEKNPTKYSEISEKILQNIDYIFPECKNFVPHYNSSSIIKISENGAVKVIRV